MEMSTWHRMMTNSWTEKKLNEEVLNVIQEQKHIIKIIETRKIKFLKHVIRHNKCIINIIKGKINGKRRRELPREI